MNSRLSLTPPKTASWAMAAVVIGSSLAAVPQTASAAPPPPKAPTFDITNSDVPPDNKLGYGPNANPGDPNGNNAPIVMDVPERGQTIHFNGDLFVINPNAGAANVLIVVTPTALGLDFTDKVVSAKVVPGNAGTCLGVLGGKMDCSLNLDLVISPADIPPQIPPDSGLTAIDVSATLAINGVVSPAASYVFDVKVHDLAGGRPEPSTWAMMLFGFAALGYTGYRRTKKAASEL